MARPATLAAVWLAAVAAAGAVETAHAQELEPRAYTNTPVGINFLIAGYAFQQGDVVTDPGLPLDDAEVDLHSAVLAYARSFALFGQSAKVDVIVPYSFVSGSATFRGEPQSREIDGFNDPRFRLSMSFYGAPALTVAELADWQQDLLIGASFAFTAPLGQYDETKLLNIGTNRWSFKPEIGISKAFGPLTVEIAPSMTFYTDNDEFFGDHTREQDPIYAVQGHLIYRFGAPLWGAVDGAYYGGGRTTTDGEKNDNRQSNGRIGLTLALSLSRHHSIKLYASKTVATRAGGDFDAVGAALQYRWGGGL